MARGGSTRIAPALDCWAAERLYLQNHRHLGLDKTMRVAVMMAYEILLRRSIVLAAEACSYGIIITGQDWDRT